MKINLPNAVTTKIARQVLVTQKHSPRILFLGGMALMGATVVSACKGTLQLEGVLEDIRLDREDVKAAAVAEPERFTDRELTKLNAYITLRGAVRVAKLYLPALSLGVAAVACLAGSNDILTRRNAGLSAALAATDKALKDYRGRVIDELGEDKDREFMFGTEEVERTTVKKDGTVKKTKHKIAGQGRSPYARIWGRDTSTEWDPQPESNLAKLRSVQSWATMVLQSRGHLFLNEVHDELGLDRTPAGAVVGWLSEEHGGDGYVDFGVLNQGTEVKFLEFMTGHEDHIMIDFNVDGEIWKAI